MGLVTEDAVRALAAFKGKNGPVVSLYLDVDGRRYPRHRDYEEAFEHLVRVRRTDAHPSVLEDIQRIEALVKAGVDRSETRALAVFACSAHDFWEVLHLAVPVRNQFAVNHTPHVRQLESVLNNHARLGVLVVDRQRARMLVLEQGLIIDRSELFDLLPRHDDDRGDWDKDHVRDHTAALALAHVRRGAQGAFSLYQERPFDHLVVVAPPELAPAVERELHTYLRERIAARVTLPTNTTIAEIQAAALAVAAEVERGKEAATVQRLRERVGAGTGAVAGLEPVISALGERRVETLVVSEGYETPGWRCWVCAQVATKGRRCPTCAGDMVRVDDVIEEAVEVALGHSSRVVTCQDNPDLDVLGRVGAFLRF